MRTNYLMFILMEFQRKPIIFFREIVEDLKKNDNLFQEHYEKNMNKR